MLRSLFNVAGIKRSAQKRVVEKETSPDASAKPPRVVQESADPKSPGLRILVAEDNPVNQKMMLLLLLRLGYTPDLAPDGRQAVEMVRDKGYDLVLMDLHMPVMGGLEATRIINLGRSPNGRPRIVAVTADTTTEARQACEQLGMDGFISKPFDRERLQEVITRIAA